LKNGDLAATVLNGLTFNTIASPRSKVGIYEITVSGAFARNYDVVSYAPGTLTINQRPLTVTAQSFERTVTQPDPIFTTTISGLSDFDNPGIVTNLGAALNVTGPLDVGTYPIIPTAKVSNSNYQLVLVSGTLTVNRPCLYACGSVHLFDYTAPLQITQTPINLDTLDVDTLDNQAKQQMDAMSNLPINIVCLGANCATFPLKAMPEVNKIVDSFVTDYGDGSQPPLTSQMIKDALLDPDQSGRMMGVLMPSLVAEAFQRSADPARGPGPTGRHRHGYDQRPVGCLQQGTERHHCPGRRIRRRERHGRKI
jgi:hypothetical protein